MRNCLHCGDCCKLLMQLGNGSYIRVPIYCPAYNERMKRCDIYEHRHRIIEIVPGLDCKNAKDQISDYLQPRGCAMVNPVKYRSKVRTVEDISSEQRKQIEEEMAGYRLKIAEWAKNGFKNE